MTVPTSGGIEVPLRLIGVRLETLRRLWGACPRSVSRVLCVMSGGDLKLGPREMPSSSIPDRLEKLASDIESRYKYQ